jgi:peptidyl-prolyl cis-trans isomerase D
MFDSIRSHRRWMMLFMLVLIFPSFVFFGIQGYNRFMGKEGELAMVGDTSISQQEFDIAQRDRAERMRQSFGASFDPRMLESPEARAAILDGLILDHTLTQEASRGNLRISDDQLRDFIARVPAFQDEGRFSIERYKAYLASQGQSERAFEERVRQDLRKQMLVQSVTDTVIVPKQVADRLEHIVQDSRDLRLLTLPTEAYLGKVKIDETQVAEFYEKNRKLFETPENLKVEFLVLDADSLSDSTATVEADLRAYYDQNKGRYGTEEQRRASHILITPDGGDKAAARKKAEELLARIKANPGDFAKLAKEQSKDPGSAAQGGDLGFFGKGMMVKPFEDATMLLKPGETSEVVETDFGFHVIRLTEIRPAQVRPYEEVRGDIEKEVRSQQARKKLAESSELFTNLVYEQSDSLQPAAEKLKLKIQTQDQVTRDGLPAAQGQPPIFGPRLIEALFSDDSIKNKRNTQAIEIAPGVLVSARIVEHRPAAVRPLDEVKAAVRQRLERQEAARLAREAGLARLEELRKQPSDAGFSPVLNVSRRAPQGVPAPMLNEVMRAPADKLPQYVGKDIEGAGYLIGHVLSSKPGSDLTADQRDAQTRAIAQQVSMADELAYAEAMRKRYGARVLRSDLKGEAGKDESGAAYKAGAKADLKTEAAPGAAK